MLFFCGLARESKALRAQAAELDVAEKHEQEALRRRERAVGHGAHPDHGFLGSQNPNRAPGGPAGHAQGFLEPFENERSVGC